MPGLQGAALASARERFGLTPDRMAAEFGVAPPAYAACEAGRTARPQFLSEQVAFRAAMVEVEEVVAREGPPPCPWMADWRRQGPGRDVATWVDARPAWARPALVGAGLLAALTAVRVAFLLPSVGREPRVLLVALGAMALAVAAGTGGGLVYAFVGRPLRRVPVAGPYLAGIVAVWGYLGCAFGALGLAPGEHTGPSLTRASDLACIGGYGVVLGFVLGHQLSRRPRP